MSARLILGLVAAFGLPAAAITGAAVVDQQEHNLSYSVDFTFAGDRAVFEHDSGKLGLRHRERLVGYFLAGHPHAIGFGCDGYQAPVIAIEAADLPHCRRVAPIEEGNQ